MSPINRVHEDELGWDERLRTHQGVPFTGVGFRLYSNGLLMFEIPYINGRPDGLMKELDAEGRLTRVRELGKSLVETVDPDYDWVMALADRALARQSREALEARGEDTDIPDPEVSEYRYDADGNRLYRLEIDPH
jgi:hypothetical protein